jgi:hypothetical protein
MKDYRTSLYTSVIAILVLVAVSLFYAYTYAHLRDMNDATVYLESIVAARTHQAEQETELAQAITQLQTTDQDLSSYFVTGDQATAFLQTIAAYGTVSGAAMKFTAVNYDKADSTIAMTLRVSGTFQSVYRSLLLLENAPYQFAWNGVTLSRDPSSLKSKTVLWDANVQFTLTSFSLASQ